MTTRFALSFDVNDLPEFVIDPGQIIFPASRTERVGHKRIPAAEAFFKTISERAGLDWGEDPMLMLDTADGAYNEVDHAIRIRPFAAFATSEEYYRVLAHETIHWTMPVFNRNRVMAIKRDALMDQERLGYIPHAAERERAFGIGYAKEELIAEEGARKLVQHLGIATDETAHKSATYLGYYTHELLGLTDPASAMRIVAEAQRDADEAVRYLIGLQP